MNPREFAVDIVRRLQEAGYQALWAGGCVRDHVMGRQPKDYDIATDATPEQVQSLFGKRRTLAIGAAFGVVAVIGSRKSGNVEIATFRRDADYSDGRHPDAVEFTNAREDALRRDFTINGMFYDPISEQVIDYVDGKADIECRTIRAIGDPELRFAEDKLRMLRAVRFAACFEFEIDPTTLKAIQHHAAEINLVSGERIGGEMRRMLAHENRSLAVELLKESGLLNEILQDGDQLYQNRANWRTRRGWLAELGAEGTFEQSAFVLLSRLLKQQGIEPTARRWKLSNAESDSIRWFEKNLITLSRAHHLPWSVVQPLFINKDIDAAIKLLEVQFGTDHEGVRYCVQKLQLDEETLNPKPLIGGSDLAALEIPAGPIYSTILNRIRAAQLDRHLESRDDAVRLAIEIYQANQ